MHHGITCYKCGQLGNYASNCPFDDDEAESMKKKGSNPGRIIRGVRKGVNVDVDEAAVEITQLNVKTDDDES